MLTPIAIKKSGLRGIDANLKKIAVVPNQNRDAGLSFTCEVIDFLKKTGVSVYMEEAFKGTAEGVHFVSRSELLSACGMVIVIGGDGTILDIAKDAAVFDVPVMGINLGNLGFLSFAEKDDFSMVERAVNGDFTIQSRMMAEANIISNGKCIKTFTALNDVVISRGGYSKMVNLNISIDGALADAYFADGIIISTPTGSTAYALSAGGPIIHPDVDIMLVTPICPHTLKARSMVIPANKKICIGLNPKYEQEAVVTVDGGEAYALKDNEFVEVTCSNMRTRLVHNPGISFFELLRDKLTDRQE